MKYVVDRDFYSYFGGANKHEYKCFTNLMEAWNEFKKTRKNDFDYGDAYQYTTFRFYRNDSVALKPQRPHARSAEEWRRIVWEKEDALQRERLANEGMNALFEDVIDVEPIIYDEYEYVFDKDDIKF